MTTTIVLTRPEADSDRLAARLSEAGIASQILPLLRIEPADAEPLRSVVQPEPGAIFIFISANAVRFGLPHLLPAIKGTQSTVIAVGERTRSMLAEAQLMVRVPERADSEGLLALEDLQSVRDTQIVIVKGVGGRGLLATTLTERGARVEECICYQRTWPKVDVSALEQTDADWIFQASSGETLARLSQLLTGAGLTDLFQCPVIVPSGRVAMMASQLGWARAIRAHDAGDEAFIEALSSLLPSDQRN